MDLLIFVVGDLQTQADDLSCLIEKDAGLIAVFIPHEFPALDTYMFFAVVIYGNVIDGEADRTTG